MLSGRVHPTSVDERSSQRPKVSDVVSSKTARYLCLGATLCFLGVFIYLITLGQHDSDSVSNVTQPNLPSVPPSLPPGAPTAGTSSFSSTGVSEVTAIVLIAGGGSLLIAVAVVLTLPARGRRLRRRRLPPLPPPSHESYGGATGGKRAAADGGEQQPRLTSMPPPQRHPAPNPAAAPPPSHRPALALIQNKDEANEAEADEVLRVFRWFQTGPPPLAIELRTLSAALQALGIVTTSPQLNEALGRYGGALQAGRFELAEFRALVAQLRPLDEVLRVFQLVDRDGSLDLERSELLHALQMLKISSSGSAQSRRLLARFERNCSQRLDLDAFRRLVAELRRTPSTLGHFEAGIDEVPPANPSTDALLQPDRAAGRPLGDRK